MSSEGSDVDCYVRDPDYDPKYYESTPSDVVENVDTDFDTDEPKSTSTILAEEDQGGDQDDDPDFNKEEDQKEGQEEDQDDGYEEDQDEDQEEDQKDDQDDDWEEGQDDDQEEAHEEDQDGDHEEDQDDDHEEDQDDDDQEEDPLKGKFTIRKKKNLRTYVKGQNKKTKTTKTEVSVNVTVKTCTKRKDNKRSWDKKHYCLYCHQPNNKMARHLQRKHMEVKDVAHAFSFASKSPQRKVLLEQIRRKGDFKHNVRVLAEGKGQIVTVKQPSHKTSAWHYLPCKFCYGMFSRTDLWRHQGSCKLKTSSETDNKRKTRGAVQSVSARLLPIMASSSGCQAIINKMRQDDVSFHIRGDSLICNYGESLYAKHGRVKSKHNYISQRMRELGRFMLTAKAMDSTVRTLEDICVPKKFLLVVNAAKKLTEFSPSKNEYGKPSTAVRVGFCLKGAVEVLIGQSLMNDDDLAEKKAKKFLELLEKNWKTHVAVSAHQSMQEKRWNKPDDIHLTKNVMALRDHLRMVEDKARAELEQQLSLTAYKVLNESILAQLIVFNKRREGEASRLTLEAYKKVNTNPINEDIYSTLSPLEKELSKQLTRIEVRGKRGKKVPVFFTHRMMESIQVLLKWRDEAGVPTENPYLFARAGVLTNIRGCDCLRKYAEESKAENPELLRSTKLRKQVATLCQLLDLDEQELEQVARFMGHDIRVHRDFYRQTDKTFQIAKISKLLFAMEQGSSTLTGRNFNTLHPSVSGESPTPTQSHVTSPIETDEEDEDKGRDLCSPAPCSEDDDENLSFSQKPSQKKRKKSVKARDKSSNLISKKRHAPCPEDDDDDDDQGPELFHPRKRPTPCSGLGLDGHTDNYQSPTSSHTQSPSKKKENTKQMKETELPKVVRRAWSEAEKTAVRKHLLNFIEKRRVPGKEACMRCKEKENILEQRSWKDIKNFVYNAIVTLARKAALRQLQFS